MKKIMFMCAACMTMMLCACGQKAAETEEAEADSTVVEAVEAEQPVEAAAEAVEAPADSTVVAE